MAGVVTAVTVLPFALLFAHADYSPLPVYSTLIWLLPAILLGNILLILRQAMMQVIAVLGLILSFYWLLPDVTFTNTFLPPLLLLSIMSILLLLFRRYLHFTQEAQQQRERLLYAGLQANERQFRLLFEQAPIGMAIATPDGRFLRINQAYCDTTGYSAAELQQMNLVDITHADDRDANVQLIQQLLDDEIPGFFLEKRYNHKSGKTIHALLQVVLERDADGRPVHLIGQIVDITDRKKAEEARRENQQLLQGLIENSTALIFVKDLDGRYVLVNTPFEKAIHLPRAEILGRTDHDLLPATVAARLRQNDAEVIHGGIPIQYEENPSENFDGATYLSIKFPLCDDAGNPYALAGMSTDITAQKETENLLRQQKVQLEALRQIGLEIAAQLDLNSLLQSIIAHSVEIVNGDKGALWLYQPDQDVLQLAAGHNGTLPVGTTIARGQDVVGAVWQSGQPMVVANYSEYLNHTPTFEQNLRNMSILGIPIFWGNTVQGAISIAKGQANFFTDADAELLTLLAAQAAIALGNARLHDNNQRHSQELARSNQDLQDFAYAASHDMQEPLRKIQTFSDRLQVRYADQLDERGLDYLQRMQQAATRMQMLIEDLLTFSRVTTQARPFAPVDLHEVLTTVLTDLEMRIEDTNATIQLDPLPTIDADATQMAQLFLNLLSNALKFVAPGRPPVIHVSSQPADRSSYTIMVSDNGIGFDEKYLDRIFGVFQRLHGRQEYSGTGVGLAICQKIVKRHGGHITAHSQPGEGATFIVTLPAHQSSEQ
ncbi:MAG TPA: PAS domain S-box protein [Chloroflexota bacterium]|nr:PAS domain S-box protein [Chloroflexota bacterium]